MSGQAPAPGQAAYEALHTDEDGEWQPGFILWEFMLPERRDRWERAVQASIDVFLAGDSVSAESIREALAAQEQPAPELAELVQGWRDTMAEIADQPMSSGETAEYETLRTVIRQVEQAAPAAASLAALRSGIAGLAADLDRSAAQTRPSRKSEIETETAIALRRLLETP